MLFPTKALLTLVMSGFLFQLLGAKPVEVGTTIDAPVVTIDTGEELDLSETFQQGLVLVYFYPKANTPGCTTQACNLRDAFAELTEAGIRVIGVSTDDVAAQKMFKDDHNLPFTLVADTERQLVKAFRVGILRDTMAARQSFLLQDGVVIWRDLKATPASQAADALAAARSHESAG